LTFTYNDDHSCVYTWEFYSKNIRLARQQEAATNLVICSTESQVGSLVTDVLFLYVKV